jgi:hypothetical protein
MARPADLVGAFRERLVAPRLAIVARRERNERIGAQLNELEVILQDSLDPMALITGLDFPEFEAQYRAARLVIDTGSRRRINPDDTNSALL